MNFGFTREIAPIVTQVPQNIEIMDRYSLWRFDDIWGGYILQSLIALKGDAITIGDPVVVHTKAGDLRREVSGEHYGHLVSPYFYDLVDRAVEDCSPMAPYAEAYAAFAQGFRGAVDRGVPSGYRPLLRALGLFFERWSELFLSDSALASAPFARPADANMWSIQTGQAGGTGTLPFSTSGDGTESP
ncbi:MAG: hypothetical protein CME06_16330 [Gemmatimonadetes bacterium]|nr:hypothetical protein [Gemmatimonadota bacterium]